MEVAPLTTSLDASESLPLVAADLVSATLTAEGECLDCNDAWRRVFGSASTWSRLPADDARFATDYVSEAARGHLVTHQVFLVSTEGTNGPCPVLIHFHPVRLPGAAVGHYPVLVSGEVLREPVSWALEQTRRRRMEVVGQMTMGVAHDFNNLLTTVLGHAELLRHEIAGESRSADESLRSLTRAALDGAALVKKIQAYLRHEKRDRFEPVDLSGLVAEVVTLTRPYWYNEPRRQGIAIELDADLSPVPPIPGYPTELREVLVNLVLNAVQAMPAGGSISITCERDARRGAAVVEVGDSGVGMPERVLRRIFEPLFTTKGENGTGMGLAVAHGIIQEHGGRIEVESTAGQGSLFRIVLPYTDDPSGALRVDTLTDTAHVLATGERNEAAKNGTAHNGTAHNGTAHNGTAHNGTAHNGTAHNGTAHNGTAHNGTAHNGTALHETLNGVASLPAEASTDSAPPLPLKRPLRLLVVDDEPMVRTITSRLLGLRGHTVTAVHGGLRALEAMDSTAFDCVVTDLSMPEMNGRELAGEIRKRHRNTPVVLLTGDTDAEIDGETVAAVVRKPFNADKLEAVLTRVASV